MGVWLSFLIGRFLPYKLGIETPGRLLSDRGRGGGDQVQQSFWPGDVRWTRTRRSSKALPSPPSCAALSSATSSVPSSTYSTGSIATRAATCASSSLSSSRSPTKSPTSSPHPPSSPTSPSWTTATSAV